VGLKGIKLRKFGQQIIQAITGKRVHGAATVPGGMNKPLTLNERDSLLADIDAILAWSQDAVTLNEEIHVANPTHRDFATLYTPFLSMVGSRGELEFYHGGLRASLAAG